LRVAERIVREGEVQITTEQRRKLVESKRLQIANLIARQAIDPRTDAPHPPDRIMNAMEEAGVGIDPFLPADQQVESVVRDIASILPLKFQRRTLRLRIPSPHAGKAYPVLRRYGEVVGERWLADGSLEIDVKLMAGLQPELFQRLSALTHGNFVSQVIEREDLR
jgi:ribosome maturation protein SDO1